MKKTSKNTKGKIINAAWKLFYEQGYDDTTVEEIIYESKTSKGSFYHYFEGKDALLGSLSYLFDEKYEELKETIGDDDNSFDVLIKLNQELFAMIEDSISISLLSRLLSTQLVTKGEKHLLDRNRVYYKLLKQIVSNGQAKGEITKDMAANEIVKMYALLERSMMYDWCLCNGEYSLTNYAMRLMPMFLAKIRL
ncbi:MAG: TetR/AcrR family transcriptional regulator [Ruminococcaceae bacterium]|nr:TetR/AcrR family transcriptional regulator [Oscillospiraceae bacterium]